VVSFSRFSYSIFYAFPTFLVHGETSLPHRIILEIELGTDWVHASCIEWFRYANRLSE
jgi:hypothetical protein